MAATARATPTSPARAGGTRDSALADVERVFGTLARRWMLPRVRERLMAGVDLEPSGFTLLRRLDDLGPTRASDLAHHIGLDLSTVSRQVAALLAVGLVDRTPDPQDRRAGLLAVSAQGRGVLDRALHARCALLAEALGDWSAADLRALAFVLERFAESISSFAEGASSPDERPGSGRAGSTAPPSGRDQEAHPA